MIEVLRAILPYISGIYTLPWILIGFIVTIAVAQLIGREKIDKIMKNIGLVLLYFFIPVLLFRIFLDLFTIQEVGFVVVATFVIIFMYIIAYIYAKYSIKKQKLSGIKQNLYFKTVLTNQGRSSAFIGSAMMAYWQIEAGIFMALVGIGLFAVIPYYLSHLHKKETAKPEMTEIKALPWFLKVYPWYLILFVIIAIVLNFNTGIKTSDFGDAGFLLKFYTAITIPAALYYVGAGMHPSDLKLSELKKLLGIDGDGKSKDHWTGVRKIFIMTVVITPIIIALLFMPLFIMKIIPASWFAVILINAILPITSTNMFLVPYGIDKKTTAHVVTWTTLVCVPIVVILIFLFDMVLLT